MIPWFDLDKHMPTLFRLSGHPVGIHFFGILVASGILIGAKLTTLRGRQLGLRDHVVAQMITWSLVPGFIFAHVFDVIAYRTAGGNPGFFDYINVFAGISSFGGFIGAIAGMIYWAKVHRQPVMPYADSLAFGLAAGWFFGRLGCFTAHDHPGRLTHFFLSLQYPTGQRHDLGLDEALWALCITTTFLLLFQKNRPVGLYVTLLTLAYAPVRFVLDFLRATDVPGSSDVRYFGLTPAQYCCVAVLFAGIGLLIFTVHHERKRLATKSRVA